MRIRVAAAVVALVALLAGCGGGDKPTPTTTAAPAPKLQVAVTSTQLADFVRVVGGDQVEVTTLADTNQTIASYKPDANDTTALARSDVVVRVGQGLDNWINPLLGGDSNAAVVDASEGVTTQQRIVNGQSVLDPYYWMSPVNARIVVANVADALAQRDPKRTDQFRSNERAYSAQLDSLRRDIERTLSSLVAPKAVTSANNFGYFAKEYGIAYVGAVDSMAQADLVAAIKAQQVKAVLTDNTSSASPSFAVASAAGVKPVAGANMLYVESLGPEGSKTMTYLDAMRHNADVLVGNLA